MTWMRKHRQEVDIRVSQKLEMEIACNIYQCPGYFYPVRDLSLVCLVHTSPVAFSSPIDPSEFTLPTSRTSFVLGWRWIDDSPAWIIDFDTADVIPPQPANPSSSARTHDPVAICSFSLRYNAYDHAYMEFCIADGSSVTWNCLMSLVNGTCCIAS
ncbi:hypothetical protein VTO73DRAFT_13149 [Trametes versicolor]